GGDETTLGYLLASFAGGALAGSVFLIFWRNQTSPSRLMIIWAVIWHLFLIAFAQSQSLPYAMAMQFGAGLSQSLSMVSLALMLLQTADVRLRGRVMGVRMMAIYSLPLGLMSAGALIQQFGFPAVATGYTAMGLLVTILIATAWRRSVWLKGAMGPV
ncbi:MAG: arabinose ABC transporter permease, partial [Hyphomicrobiaceae bacterium]|nr:arabinose ABC transporter permease [Hyphomicrobiaceae bacterium]